MRSPAFMPVPANSQWSGRVTIQSPSPTPYDVEPISVSSSGMSSSSPRPVKRSKVRSARPSLDADSVISPSTALPDRNARLTPRSRARATLSNIRRVQYSSCPTERKPFARSRPSGSSWVSRFET